MTNKRAIVVEGGAMRGIFASGVLDEFLDVDFRPFDFAIGVSAGASNLVNYLAKQPQRSYHVVTELATNSRFFNPARFVKGGNLIDVDWLWKEALLRYPLNTDALFDSIPLLAAVTNVETAAADYYWVNESNLSNVIEATSALPIAYRQTPCFSGGCYTDGGVADSIPVVEAYRRGARDITVILSQPESYEMTPMRIPSLMDHILKKHPSIADAMRLRAERYNASLAFIRQPPVDCKVRVIAPPESFPVGRFTMKKAKLDEGYHMGRQAAKNHIFDTLKLTVLKHHDWNNTAAKPTTKPTY
ncbi:patatin-like phospholipase family protein [Enterovibrio calviensis]|uniref:patatin-like phospholipase family protein n=1 Tax=Enterovibrio calviensis TaxID=91359 RepID=UPI00068556B0|nr:patatin family protein [Enterovibrio calviensis]